MTDFKMCIKSNNGKVYCWDNLANTFVELVGKPITAGDVPEDAMREFMAAAERAMK